MILSKVKITLGLIHDVTFDLSVPRFIMISEANCE